MLLYIFKEINVQQKIKYVMWVLFNNHEKTDLAMICFYENPEKQTEMMHRLDEDVQVKEWQNTNSGNPPRFGSRIKNIRFVDKMPTLKK